MILTLAITIADEGFAQRGKKIVYKSGTQSMTRMLTGVDETIPGELTTPYPTLRNLAIEWDIEGDDNLNGVVTVHYRKVGHSEWRKAMDLRRVPKMAFDAGPPQTSSIFHWDNKHSGSILGLEPGTEYEIKCRLYDPDGGEAEKITRISTRVVPHDVPGAPVIPVTPETFRQAVAKARAGDVLLLAPGHYGYFVAEKDGAPGKPLVIRTDPFDYRERDRTPQDDGHRAFVIFDGVSLQGRKHVHLEGILSTNTIDIFNAESCAVTRCIVSGIYGIISSQQGLYKKSPDVYARLQPSPDESLYIERGNSRTLIPPHATNCYIADNILIGVNPWLPGVIHAGGKNVGEGIQISGPGDAVITEPQLHALVKNNVFIGGGPNALAARTWGKVRGYLDYDYNG